MKEKKKKKKMFLAICNQSITADDPDVWLVLKKSFFNQHYYFQLRYNYKLTFWID